MAVPLSSPVRAQVLVLEARLGLLDYLVPDTLGPLPPGTIVEVPLGSRRVPGIVWDGAASPDIAPARLKPILRRLAVPPMSTALRQTLSFLADYYVAPLGAAARLALPSIALSGPPNRPLAYTATPPPPGTALKPTERALIAALTGAPAPLAEWAARTGASRTRLKSAVLKAWLSPVPPPPPAPPQVPAGPDLSDAQAEAAATLSTAVAAHRFQAFLLDGVTGSGKTEVYFDAIAAALAAGGQALVLLPEIALTDSWFRRFEARFGWAPAVWHSSVGQEVRRRTWHDLAEARAHVVVGARSALFLPLPNLRLIIVDEAHDAAFKQEDGVFYHGRDMAVVRARAEGVPVVLASATPSLETLENAREGRFIRLILPDRHGATLPEVRLIDLVRHPPARGRWLSPPLVEAIEATLARGEQTLLFLNRRGYAPLTLCRACGTRIQCGQCTAWMVDHRLERRLQCHHCGTTMPRPTRCPDCGAEDSLIACGPGVERIAEECADRWPTARIGVATSDTIRSPADAAALFARVEARDLNLLVGTQLLAKGHDFPGLTLVGVIDADLGLEGGDLRAGERTFQQVAQVAGRAGRRGLPGTVLIQTHQPRAPLMQALAQTDRDGFLAAERAARQAAGMPPFGRLAALILSAEDEAAARSTAEHLAATAPTVPGLHILGPAPAPLAMLRGRHRIRFLLQAPRELRLQDHIRAWLARVRLPASVRLSIDIDPQSFL
jgi:primosomal protein N' (replication factor Y)